MALTVDGLLDGTGPAANKSLWWVPGRTDGDVCFPLAQAVHLVGNEHFQLNIRVTGTKLRKGARKQAGKQGIGGGDPDAAGELQILTSQPALWSAGNRYATVQTN